MRDPAVLPHDHPFRFLDRAAGDEGLRFLCACDGFWSRGKAIPPSIFLEALIQGTGVLLGRADAPEGAVVQIHRYRAPRRVYPGDEITLTADLVKRMGPLFQGRFAARRGGRIVASGIITIREVAP